jgi:predicted amidohydrolase
VPTNRCRRAQPSGRRSCQQVSKLAAAGFTEQEQIVGALTAEFKAALDLLKHGPRMLGYLAVSSAGSKVIAELGYMKGLDPLRVIASSEMIGAAVMENAEQMLAGLKIKLGEEQSGEQSAVGGVPPHLDATPAPSAKDIN